MQQTSRARGRVTPMVIGVVALGLTLVATSASASGDGADGKGSALQRETEPIAPRHHEKAGEGNHGRTSSESGPDALADTVDAYERANPQLTTGQALAAAKGQEERKQLWEDILADNTDEFGGAWFDPRANTLHVNVTNLRLGRKVRAEARAAGLNVDTHRVRYTFDELEEQAAGLREARGRLGKAVDDRVGLNVRTNEVVVRVAPRVRKRIRRQTPGNVQVLAAKPQDVEADACTDRKSCPDAVRSGSILWRGSRGSNVCSAGATAVSSSTNRRYVLTAGHCAGAFNQRWGTANRSIGTRWAAKNSGDVDVSTIWVRYWPFAFQSNGEIWAQWKANRAVDMDSVAPTQSWIWEGDTVCLSANYTDPDAFGNRCGVIEANADASVRGMTRVEGVDACGGDSGGGWYWLTGSGSRYGYGIHSRSNRGCNGSSGGDTSWFTTLPRVKTWIPSLDYETQ